MNEEYILKLHKNDYSDSFNYESLDVYNLCLFRKMTKTSFMGERAFNLLRLILTDVYGLISIFARCGFSYFITFTDDHSIYGYVYLMRYRFENFEKFKIFETEVEK